MKVDGIWCMEITGINGWERIGTVILENGRYIGGSADHYSIGHYKKKKALFKAYTRITQYGDARAIFGNRKQHFDAVFEGAIDKKSGQIRGRSRPATGKAADVGVRLTLVKKLD